MARHQFFLRGLFSLFLCSQALASATKPPLSSPNQSYCAQTLQEDLPNRLKYKLPLHTPSQTFSLSSIVSYLLRTPILQPEAQFEKEAIAIKNFLLGIPDNPSQNMSFPIEFYTSSYKHNRPTVLKHTMGPFDLAYLLLLEQHPALAHFLNLQQKLNLIPDFKNIKETHLWLLSLEKNFGNNVLLFQIYNFNIDNSSPPLVH